MLRCSAQGFASIAALVSANSRAPTSVWLYRATTHWAPLHDRMTRACHSAKCCTVTVKDPPVATAHISSCARARSIRIMRRSALTRLRRASSSPVPPPSARVVSAWETVVKKSWQSLAAKRSSSWLRGAGISLAVKWSNIGGSIVVSDDKSRTLFNFPPGHPKNATHCLGGALGNRVCLAAQEPKPIPVQPGKAGQHRQQGPDLLGYSLEGK